MNLVLNERYLFAGFVLDLTAGRLFADGDEVRLRPKAFALLSYLVRNAGRVVSKDELMTVLWPDVTVTEDSLTQCVRDVRQALRDEGAAMLRTVPRRGYLFEDRSDAKDLRPAAGVASAGGSVTEGVEPAPDLNTSTLRRDGIAVMPFIVTSDNPADTPLFDGLAHDVISRLARLRSFHVIARGSTFALRHLATDPQAAGRLLNVAYALSGAAEVQGNQCRPSVDLVHVESGAIVWTDMATGPRDLLLSLLPEWTERIVYSVEMQVTTAEVRRALAIPKERFDAWAQYHTGLHDAFRFDPQRIGRALERLGSATDLEPGFARAHAAQSFCHYFRVFSGTAPDRTAGIAAARRSAEDALHADDMNPSAHWAFGRALWLEGSPDECLQYSERSMALSPGFALGHYMIGFVETHGGDARRALAQIDRVLSLSPFDPFLASFQITRAIALLRLDQIDEAANLALSSSRQPNTSAYPAILAPAALILAAAGRREEARQIITRLRAAAPDFGSAQMHRSLYRLSDDVAAVFRRAAQQIDL
jgi:DNA-binding winged helix-turn-helix (wHTH) protein/tetratricopeptide (TPR) repeat protein